MHKLNKTIQKIVSEEFIKLSEGFRGFSITHMKSLNSPNEMIKYAEKYLPELGSGTSRTVFAWKAGKVIKIMHDDHNPQNKLEVDASFNSNLQPIVAKIFDYDEEEYLWIVAEGIKVIKDNSDLISNFTLSDTFLSKFENESENSGSWQEAFQETIEYYNEHIGDNLDMMDFTKHDIELLKKIYIAVSNDLIDVDRYEHWGKTSDGRIVLVDYGLDQSVI